MFTDYVDLGIATAAEYERMVQRLMLERQALATAKAEKSASRKEHWSGHFGWFPKPNRSAQ